MDGMLGALAFRERAPVADMIAAMRDLMSRPTRVRATASSGRRFVTMHVADIDDAKGDPASHVACVDGNVATLLGRLVPGGHV